MAFSLFRFEFVKAVLPSALHSGLGQQWSMNTGRTVFSQLMEYLPKYEVSEMCESLFGRLQSRRVMKNGGNNECIFVVGHLCPFFDDGKIAAKSLAETIRVDLCRSSASSPLLPPVTR